MNTPQFMGAAGATKSGSHTLPVVCQLLFSGVFERFTDIKLLLVESNIGWIPTLLEQVDDMFYRYRFFTNGESMRATPSRIFHRNFWATFMVDTVGMDLRHRLNVDQLMWSTDYPHTGSDWPNSRITIERNFRGVPNDRGQEDAARQLQTALQARPRPRHDRRTCNPSCPVDSTGRSRSSPVPARGQGAAEARLFAAEGARVLLGDVLDDEGAAVAARDRRRRGVPPPRRHERRRLGAPRSTTSAVAGAALHVLVAQRRRCSPLPRAIADTPVEEYSGSSRSTRSACFRAHPPLRAAHRRERAREESAGAITVVSSVNGLVGAAGSRGVRVEQVRGARPGQGGRARARARQRPRELGAPGRDRHDHDLARRVGRPRHAPAPRRRAARSAGSGTPEDVAELVCWLSSDASVVLHRRRVRRSTAG